MERLEEYGKTGVNNYVIDAVVIVHKKCYLLYFYFLFLSAKKAEQNRK